LLVLKTKEGAVLGGYADEAWQLGTDWTGEADNFLFRLRSVASDPITDQGAMGVWDGHQGVNRHFQYLCWGKKSLPNGLGMGGQFEYAGVWFNSDFSTGHSRGDPVCTTYMSPPLAPKETFSIDEVEVWLVRPLPHDEDEEEQAKGSALDRSEDMAFLEMAGKKLYSRDLSKPEEE
ncbi:TLD-domain-containing protein, partial [Spinellus fusiger]